MKVRFVPRAALFTGLCALILRLFQYGYGLDSEGYILPTPLAKGLMIALIVLLAGGVLYALIGCLE